MAYITDAQGHEWTITGYWCTACGFPLHHIYRTSALHPMCEYPTTDQETSSAQ